MMSDRTAGRVFREGEEVVLAKGTYQGTLGVFVRLKEDVNWADIAERNGEIRSHPVVWLDHATVPGRRFAAGRERALRTGESAGEWLRERTH